MTPLDQEIGGGLGWFRGAVPAAGTGFGAAQEPPPEPPQKQLQNQPVPGVVPAPKPVGPIGGSAPGTNPGPIPPRHTAGRRRPRLNERETQILYWMGANGMLRCEAPFLPCVGDPQVAPTRKYVCVPGTQCLPLREHQVRPLYSAAPLASLGCDKPRIFPVSFATPFFPSASSSPLPWRGCHLLLPHPVLSVFLVSPFSFALAQNPSWLLVET